MSDSEVDAVPAGPGAVSTSNSNVLQPSARSDSAVRVDPPQVEPLTTLARAIDALQPTTADGIATSMSSWCSDSAMRVDHITQFYQLPESAFSRFNTASVSPPQLDSYTLATARGQPSVITIPSAEPDIVVCVDSFSIFADISSHCGVKLPISVALVLL